MERAQLLYTCSPSAGSHPVMTGRASAVKVSLEGGPAWLFLTKGQVMGILCIHPALPCPSHWKLLLECGEVGDPTCKALRFSDGAFSPTLMWAKDVRAVYSRAAHGFLHSVLRGSEQNKSSIDSLPLWTRTSPMSGYHLKLKLCHPANYSAVCACARAYVTRPHVAQAALNSLWG